MRVVEVRPRSKAVIRIDDRVIAGARFETSWTMLAALPAALRPRVPRRPVLAGGGQ